MTVATILKNPCTKHIFRFLDLVSLGRIGQVCKGWKKILEDQEVWKFYFEARWSSFIFDKIPDSFQLHIKKIIELQNAYFVKAKTRTITPQLGIYLLDHNLINACFGILQKCTGSQDKTLSLQIRARLYAMLGEESKAIENARLSQDNSLIGEILIDQEKWEEAKSHYESFLFPEGLNLHSRYSISEDLGWYSVVRNKLALESLQIDLSFHSPNFAIALYRYANKDFGDAIELLENKITHNNSTFDQLKIKFLIARIYWEMAQLTSGEYKEHYFSQNSHSAVSKLTNLLQTAPFHVQANCLLHRIQKVLQKETRQFKDNPITSLENALIWSPQATEALFLMGQYIAAKDPEKGKECILKAKQNGLESAELLYILSTLEENREQKLVYLDQVLQKDPMHLEAAIDQVKHRPNSSATASLKKLTQKFPNDFRLWMLWGNACRELKQYDQAIACFTKVIELLNPQRKNFSELVSHQEVAYYEKTEAIKEACIKSDREKFHCLKEQDIKNALTFAIEIKNFYRQHSCIDFALELAREIASLAPESSEHRLDLAELIRDKMQNSFGEDRIPYREEIIKLYEEEIDSIPQAAKGYLLLGNFYDNFRNFWIASSASEEEENQIIAIELDKAWSYYEIALEKEPNNIEVLDVCVNFIYRENRIKAYPIALNLIRLIQKHPNRTDEVWQRAQNAYFCIIIDENRLNLEIDQLVEYFKDDVEFGTFNLQNFLENAQQNENNRDLFPKQFVFSSFLQLNAEIQIQVLNQIIAINPSHYGAYMVLINIYKNEGNIEKLIPLYQKLINLKGLAFFNAGGQLASIYEHNDPKLAVDLLNQLAIDFLKRYGSNKQAQECAARALKIVENSQSHYLLGVSYFFGKEKALAKEYLSQIPIESPNYAKALYLLSQLTQERDDANNYLQKALQIEPSLHKEGMFIMISIKDFI